MRAIENTLSFISHGFGFNSFLISIIYFYQNSFLGMFSPVKKVNQIGNKRSSCTVEETKHDTWSPLLQLLSGVVPLCFIHYCHTGL